MCFSSKQIIDVLKNYQPQLILVIIIHMQSKKETNIKELLQKYFGFNSFRPLQQESVDAIKAKKDLLTILPTGGGKSLCYQLPALYFKDQLTIVISPLIALINDQVINLELNNIKADKLTSELNYEETQEVYRRIYNKEVSLLYVSPERANMDSFKNLLRNIDVGFIVIDEAHCVSEWGHAVSYTHLTLPTNR